MQSIHIVADSLPEAWERAVIETWEKGAEFETAYDKEGDPKSKDVTALIHVKNPFAEPRIHRAFPGGLDDLEKYRMEVLHGVHDHWVDPANGKWNYTYHERLFGYKLPGSNFKVDQIALCIDELKKTPHTRRAQAVTWQVWNDLGYEHASCLQRLWFRVENGKLNMCIHIRSNDAYKAAFMNMHAFTELQRWVAWQVGVEVGEYIHIADSFHIYGSYFSEFEGFLNAYKSRSFEDRIWDTSFAVPMFIDGCNTLLAEPDMPNEMMPIIRERLNTLHSMGPASQR